MNQPIASTPKASTPKTSTDSNYELTDSLSNWSEVEFTFNCQTEELILRRPNWDDAIHTLTGDEPTAYQGHETASGSNDQHVVNTTSPNAWD